MTKLDLPSLSCATTHSTRRTPSALARRPSSRLLESAGEERQ